MTTTPAVLIENRDYSWTPSSREGFHSFCHLDSGPHEGSRVAAIQQQSRGWGWLLIWGPDDAGHRDGPWQCQAFDYVLDARDVVARRLPAYVAEHRALLLPADA